MRYKATMVRVSIHKAEIHVDAADKDDAIEKFSEYEVPEDLYVLADENEYFEDVGRVH